MLIIEDVYSLQCISESINWSDTKMTSCHWPWRVKENMYFPWTHGSSVVLLPNILCIYCSLQSVLISTSINEQSRAAENSMSHTNTQTGTAELEERQAAGCDRHSKGLAAPLSLWSSYLPTCLPKQSTIKPHPLGSIHAQTHILKAHPCNKCTVFVGL